MNLLVGNKGDKTCRVVEEVINARCLAVLRTYLVKNLVGISGILRFAPFLGSKEEGGHEIDLSIRGVALSDLRAIEGTLPTEIAIPWTVGGIGHVGLSPSPEFVEHLALVELQADHHTV